ncbi:MAG: cyclase family protein [Candidatus Dormibacter sp.]|uniref:cyclase family protein n=1 Tax=Candidatus Dormibacter sp. TaxID=2973982 RepID=UPI000DB1428E|nr:MAG: cyclase [Candidatus Dormibacteraeota bacterium]
MCGPSLLNEDQRQKIAAYHATLNQVSKSPFGPEDEIGMLNLMDESSRRQAMREADAGKPFDLAVDFFVGMPLWDDFNDPGFQIWLTHTPAGTVVDNPTSLSAELNERVSYTGDAISMYTHCGTHVDTLTHFGYHGSIFNGFNTREHLGSRHWHRAGADKQPPVIARGVMIDAAAAAGIEMLPESHAIGEKDLLAALKRQKTELRPGDVVLIRTGRMSVWPDQRRFVPRSPGINREGAEFLARAGAMYVGADNGGVEHTPSADPENWLPVHTYLLAEAGIPLLEMAYLEDLSHEGIYEFAFMGACLKIRGATGSPMRPIAMPLKS